MEGYGYGMSSIYGTMHFGCAPNQFRDLRFLVVRDHGGKFASVSAVPDPSFVLDDYTWSWGASAVGSVLLSSLTVDIRTSPKESQLQKTIRVVLLPRKDKRKDGIDIP